MDDCVFCKIVAGEIPVHTLYEDAHTLAFLDIHPDAKGHTLVVPKAHATDLLAATPDIIAAVMVTVQKVARALMQSLGAEGFTLGMNNGAAAGQVVFHWHTHIIPRAQDDGLKPWPGKSYKSGEAEAIIENVKKYLV